MHAHRIVQILLETEAASPVPEAPGTVPIPENHLRLYHYSMASPDTLRREGLRLDQAKGHTYGEPNFVWASLKEPGNHKVFAEFSVAIDDPRFSMWGARPDVHRGAAFYQGRSNDFTLAGDVRPEEIIAIHEPWHHHYRYMVENGLVPGVLAGEYDYITPNSFPDEARALEEIKRQFSTAGPVSEMLLETKRGPTMKSLQKGKIPLDPKERQAVMKAGAVWHHGPKGEATPAVWKSVVKGKTWYCCHTHRAGICKPTLQAAIKAYPWVESTA